MSPRPRASLDPYGIYGTRAVRRFYGRQRRRKVQYFLLGIALLCLLCMALVFQRWRYQESLFSEKIYNTNSVITAPPIWAGDSLSRLFVTTYDGRLLQIDNLETDNLEAEGTTPEAQARQSTLLETDFPLHMPLAAQGKLFVPGENGILTALEQKSGNVLWQADFRESLTARPVLFHLKRAGQTELWPIVVAGGDGGLLMALDAATGQPVWRTRLPGPIGNGLSAVESNGRARVFVPLLGSSTAQGGIWCLDGDSAQVLWRTPQDGAEPAFQFSPPVPDLPGNRVYAANDLGAIIALNLTTGTSNPEKSVGWKTVPEPLKREDASQRVLWRAAPLLLHPSELNHHSQKAQPLLIVGGNDGSVRCISARDGIVRWQFATQAPVVSLLAVPVSEGRSGVLAVSRDRRFYLLDARNGQVIQRFASRQQPFVGAAVTQRQIFAVTENGEIHRFALSK